MRRVNITGFRRNLSHYIDLCSSEEIQITKNGKVVAVFSSPESTYFEAITNLYVCLAEGDNGSNYDDLIGKEIMRRCGY